jgi:hypothetical protein
MCQRGNCPFSTIKYKSIYDDSLPKDTAKIETGMAEKSSHGTRQTDSKKLFVFLRNRKKISQIINAYCLPLLTVLPLNYFMSGTSP